MGIRPVKKTEWWGAGVDRVVICLERGEDMHMAQLMPLPLTVPLSLASVKSRLVLPFWYRLTHRVVPDKRPLNGCVLVVQLEQLFRCVYVPCVRAEKLSGLDCFSFLGMLVYRDTMSVKVGECGRKMVPKWSV